MAFLMLWVKGYQSSHRAFTHSLLAAALFSISIAIIYCPLGGYCFIGYLSHLLLDLTNKKGIQIFYPSKKSKCCRLFYAKGTANNAFMCIGIVILVGAIVYRYMLL